MLARHVGVLRAPLQEMSVKKPSIYNWKELMYLGLFSSLSLSPSRAAPRDIGRWKSYYARYLKSHTPDERGLKGVNNHIMQDT